mgnify:FL=1
MTFLELLSRYGKIEIPRIQRNYAQGRENESIVRNSFLNDLVTVLNSDDADICLDFIYGSVLNYEDIKKEEKKKFIPVDGQQRLTTLYLLYWYVNNCFAKEKNKKINEELKKFTYEIRDSSKSFCNNLIEKGLNKITNKNKISEKIKTQVWYLLDWNMDPTIKAMLIMLDEIEQRLNDPKIKRENIINSTIENEKIYFYSIEINDFGSADEIYIKMNSRGKELTLFENFKSKLEKYIEKVYDKEYLNMYNSRIDNKWLNYFWKKLKKMKNNDVEENEIENIDDWLINIYMTIFENQYAVTLLEKDDDTIENEIKYFDNFITYQGKREIDFDNLVDMGKINKDCIKQSQLLFEYFSNKDENNDLNIVNQNDMYEKIMNINKSHSNDLRPEKVELFAVCKFLLYKNKEELESYEKLELSKILYFVRNIVENMYMDSAKKYCMMISNINNILNFVFKENGIEQYLKKISQYNHDDINELFNKNGEFDREFTYLLRGEITKAKHIGQNEEWKREILKIDKNSYFKGNTQFLFEFIKECNDEKLEMYKNYSQKIRIIFSDKPNNSKEKSIDPILNEGSQYYFKRALLTFGNYMIRYGKRYSFLVMSDKYNSWYNLLTEEKYTEQRKNVKRLLDKISESVNYCENDEEYSDLREQIENAIKDIVENYISKDTIPEWTNCCIKYPEIIKDTLSEGEGYLKAVGSGNLDNDRQILITKSKSNNARNWDFYTYVLKCRIHELLNLESIKYEYKTVIASTKFIKYHLNKCNIYVKCNYGYKFSYCLAIEKNSTELENIKYILQKDGKIDEDKKHYIFEYNEENEIIEAMKKINENIIDKTLKKL